MAGRRVEHVLQRADAVLEEHVDLPAHWIAQHAIIPLTAIAQRNTLSAINLCNVHTIFWSRDTYKQTINHVSSAEEKPCIKFE